MSLELTLAEAEAVKSWLLKPSADGSAAIDDENAKSVMVKLGARLDYIQGVQRVRDELEQAGFPTEQMTDDDVADLGRRIAGLRSVATPEPRTTPRGPAPGTQTNRSTDLEGRRELAPHGRALSRYGRAHANRSPANGSVPPGGGRAGARGRRLVPGGACRAERRLLDRAGGRRRAGPSGRAPRRPGRLRRERAAMLETVASSAPRASAFHSPRR